MEKLIMVGCDLHDKSMLLKMDVAGNVLTKRWANRPERREAMVADLKRRGERIGAKRIVFAYEASGLGFVLWDELTAAGVECYVLAPTGMGNSRKHRQKKTDERDAQRVLEHLRAHLLARNELAAVWVPDKQTRDDREVTRMRLDLGCKVSVVKSQIRCLLKRNGVEPEEAPVKSWTSGYIQWLEGLGGRRLQWGATAALASLLRQLSTIEVETAQLDRHVSELAGTPRHAGAVAAMRRDKGVGALTAMVFLTEMGDLRRFANRRQVGSYLGLTPSSWESGEVGDRKGHITHQGPSRVRKVLNQAVWSRIRSDPCERAVYERIKGKNPKHKMIAVVALMRRMGVRCWHSALEAQIAGRASASAPAEQSVAPKTAESASRSDGLVAGADGNRALADNDKSPRQRMREFFGKVARAGEAEKRPPEMRSPQTARRNARPPCRGGACRAPSASGQPGRSSGEGIETIE